LCSCIRFSLNVVTSEHVNCATVDAVKPPDRPDTPPHADLLNTKSKRSLDFAVLSDSAEKHVKESSDCNDNLLSNGRCQLDNSFIVPLEESFTESREAESHKRNICLSDSSPDNGEYDRGLYITM